MVPTRSDVEARRVWRKSRCASGPRCSPPGSVLSRAHIYGYGRSLRPPQGTSIAPRRRAISRQALLAASQGETELRFFLGRRDPDLRDERQRHDQLLPLTLLFRVGPEGDEAVARLGRERVEDVARAVP